MRWTNPSSERLKETLMRLAITFVISLVCSGAVHAQQPSPPPKLDPETFDPYLGAYEFPSGRLMIIARTDRRLYAYEPGSERLRGLERVDDRNWSAGPTLLVYTPETYHLTFLKDAKGDVRGVRYAVPGAATVEARKARVYREEEVEFRNGEITLSGTLLIPATRGPHPAIVLAHGSGVQDRNGYLANIRFLADHLARHGIAVLTYDKRGSGRSTGEWATASFADLAGDLVAGVRMLRTRPGIIAAQVGAGGSSQAGWVAAKAVTLLPDVAFVVLTSAGGSGYTVEEQNLYNTEVEMRAAGMSEDRVARALDLQRRFFAMLRRGPEAHARDYDEAVRSAREDPSLRDWIFPMSSEVDWGNRNAWYLALEVGFDPLLRLAGLQGSGPGRLRRARCADARGRCRSTVHRRAHEPQGRRFHRHRVREREPSPPRGDKSERRRARAPGALRAGLLRLHQRLAPGRLSRQQRQTVPMGSVAPPAVVEFVSGSNR